MKCKIKNMLIKRKEFKKFHLIFMGLFTHLFHENSQVSQKINMTAIFDSDNIESSQLFNFVKTLSNKVTLQNKNRNMQITSIPNGF